MVGFKLGWGKGGFRTLQTSRLLPLGAVEIPIADAQCIGCGDFHHGRTSFRWYVISKDTEARTKCRVEGGLLLAALVHKEGTFFIFMAELLTIAKEFALIVEIGMSEMLFESDSKTLMEGHTALYIDQVPICAFRASSNSHISKRLTTKLSNFCGCCKHLTTTEMHHMVRKSGDREGRRKTVGFFLGDYACARRHSQVRVVHDTFIEELVYKSSSNDYDSSWSPEVLIRTRIVSKNNYRLV
ncbi:hypothetical protein LguiA_017418 [Lonicera macranthoides]